MTCANLPAHHQRQPYASLLSRVKCISGNIETTGQVKGLNKRVHIVVCLEINLYFIFKEIHKYDFLSKTDPIDFNQNTETSSPLVKIKINPFKKVTKLPPTANFNNELNLRQAKKAHRTGNTAPHNLSQYRNPSRQYRVCKNHQRCNMESGNQYNLKTDNSVKGTKDKYTPMYLLINNVYKASNDTLSFLTGLTSFPMNPTSTMTRSHLDLQRAITKGPDASTITCDWSMCQRPFELPAKTLGEEIVSVTPNHWGRSDQIGSKITNHIHTNRLSSISHLGHRNMVLVQRVQFSIHKSGPEIQHTNRPVGERGTRTMCGPYTDNRQSKLSRRHTGTKHNKEDNAMLHQTHKPQDYKTAQDKSNLNNKNKYRKTTPLYLISDQRTHRHQDGRPRAQYDRPAGRTKPPKPTWT